MTDNALTKVVTPKATVICQDIDLEAPALGLLKPDLTTTAYLGLLIEQGMFPDAVRFLARALPKRESAWWACVCSRAAIDPQTPPTHVKALEVAEQWVYKPSEELRRNSYAAAEAARFNHPAAWAAMAVFWSGGSMAPPDAPAVPPAENLTAKAVSGAILLAAVHKEPEKAPAKFQRFLTQGMDIARGGNGRAA